MTDWDLPGDDQYSLFYEVTAANFKTRVLLSPDVWIILLVKGNIQKYVNKTCKYDFCSFIIARCLICKQKFKISYWGPR